MDSHKQSGLRAESLPGERAKLRARGEWLFHDSIPVEKAVLPRGLALVVTCAWNGDVPEPVFREDFSGDFRGAIDRAARETAVIAGSAPPMEGLRGGAHVTGPRELRGIAPIVVAFASGDGRSYKRRSSRERVTKRLRCSHSLTNSVAIIARR